MGLHCYASCIGGAHIQHDHCFIRVDFKYFDKDAFQFVRTSAKYWFDDCCKCYEKSFLIVFGWYDRLWPQLTIEIAKCLTLFDVKVQRAVDYIIICWPKKNPTRCANDSSRAIWHTTSYTFSMSFNRFGCAGMDNGIINFKRISKRLQTTWEILPCLIFWLLWGCLQSSTTNSQAFYTIEICCQ